MTYVLPTIATVGEEGIALNGIYNVYAQASAVSATNNPDTPGIPFALGTRIMATNGSVWLMCTTNTTIPYGSVCAIDSNFNATLVGGTGGDATTASAAFIGFYQNTVSLTTSQYAWFMISGEPTILVASASVTGPLYTLDTAGALTGVVNTSSHYQIGGVGVVVTASGTTASLTLSYANSVFVRKPQAGS